MSDLKVKKLTYSSEARIDDPQPGKWKYWLIKSTFEKRNEMGEISSISSNY